MRVSVNDELARLGFQIFFCPMCGKRLDFNPKTRGGMCPDLHGMAYPSEGSNGLPIIVFEPIAW